MGNFPKCHITDTEALKILTPEQIISYLESHGWKRSYFQNRGERFACSDHRRESVTVPYTNVGDYVTRVSEVLREASLFEDRSELDIYYEMLHPDHETKPTCFKYVDHKIPAWMEEENDSTT